jgi:hypothetical protein
VEGLRELLVFIPFRLLEKVNLVILVIDVNGGPCRQKLLSGVHASTAWSDVSRSRLQGIVHDGDMFGIAITGD